MSRLGYILSRQVNSKETVILPVSNIHCQKIQSIVWRFFVNNNIRISVRFVTGNKKYMYEVFLSEYSQAAILHAPHFWRVVK